MRERGYFPDTIIEEHDWWDKPPQTNTRCKRCSIKYGYFMEFVSAGRFDIVRCTKGEKVNG